MTRSMQCSSAANASTGTALGGMLTSTPPAVNAPPVSAPPVSAPPMWDMTAANAAGAGTGVAVPSGMAALCVDAGALLGMDADSAAVGLATALALLHCWGVDAAADEAVLVRVLYCAT